MDTINSHTKEAAAPIKTQWLPHYLHVHVSGNDSNSDSNSNDVTVTQSLADDLDQLETRDGGVTYELRTPRITNPNPGTGSPRTGRASRAPTSSRASEKPA